jgi:methionine aminopeptidase
VRLRQSCRLAAQIREELRTMLKPGMETRELDAYAAARIERLGAK